MRGQEQDYTNWVEATGGDQGWSWPAALARYKSFENYHGEANEWHGKGGPWTVSKQRLQWRILDLIKEAVIEYGIPETEDFNRGNNFGVGWFDVNQQVGWRLNSSQAFLKPVRHRQNLTVLTGSQADRLLFEVDRSTKEGKRCVGVKLQQHGHSHEDLNVWADKEVILCAGTIGSVQILERSGIGGAEHLKTLGVPVVADLPGVGEQLTDHLQLRLVFSVNGEKTLNTTSSSLWGKFLIGLEYMTTQSGPMSMAPSQLCVFAYSDTPNGGPVGSKFDRPNLQYHIQPLSLDKFGDSLHSFDAFTMSVCNLRPSSRGSVHISSRDPFSPPIISPNYLATEEDRQVAVDAIRLTRRIVNNSSSSTTSLRACSPIERLPGIALQSDEELATAAGHIGTTIFHPVGTCKMGAQGSESGSVCDGQLRVHGVSGLRIADASVMPCITSGNTAAPTMLIAHRAAELILAQN